jgi:shikimate kinase
MGSGKSTLGKKTAPLLGLPFYDLDDFIETQENKSISEIFSSEGETAFREKESFYLKKILDKEAQSLISLGGGTVCFNNTISLLKSKGIVVYIQLPPAALVKRLSANKASRPLIARLKDDQVLEFVTKLLSTRKYFYEQAHITLSGINLRPEHLIHEIKFLL